MITELTEDQESKFDEFVSKWVDIGLSTSPTDVDKVLECIPDYYKQSDLESPATVIFCRSPFESILYGAFILSENDAKVYDKVIAKVYDKVSAKVDAKVDAKVYAKVSAKVDAKVSAKVSAKVHAKVDAKVYAKVYAKVSAKVRAKVDAKVDAKVYAKVNAKNISDVWTARVGTSFWSGYNSWRDFMGFIGVDISELNSTFELSKNSCYIFPFDNFIIVSEKPIRISFDETGEMHNENKMAIEWSDGFGIYLLNGVRMCGNEWVVTTPKEELDPEKIMAIINVEQRLMAIKKCGIDKILSKLKSRVISEGILDESELIYKLHEVEIEGSKERLFEMNNPSEDKKHFEFVLPECNTIFEADLWRRGYDNFKSMKYERTNLRA
jgi:hypothetical protein